MPGVHRLKHVQRLGTADLANNDAVGAHSQRVANEGADRYLALALDVLRTSLQPQHVTLVELEFRRILDRNDSVVVRNRGGHCVEQGGLAGARAARDQDVELGPDAHVEEVNGLATERAEPYQAGQVPALAAELANGHERAGE